MINMYKDGTNRTFNRAGEEQQSWLANQLLMLAGPYANCGYGTSQSHASLLTASKWCSKNLNKAPAYIKYLSYSAILNSLKHALA